jgi:hypothetical protein
MRVAVTTLAAAAALLTAGCSGAAPTPAGNGGAAAPPAKIGFITKFPVDFYDTMVDAVKKWNTDHPDVTVLYAQGKSGTDDEGEINAIQSMVSQGVTAIAITPTSPNVKGELQKAVDKGVKVVLVDNDIPGWDGKSALVATDNLAGGKLAGQYLATNLKPGGQAGDSPGRSRQPVPRRPRDRHARHARIGGDHRRQAANRLRPDQRTERGPGHPDRAPGRHRYLRRLRPAGPRRASGNQIGGQERHHRRQLRRLPR